MTRIRLLYPAVVALAAVALVAAPAAAQGIDIEWPGEDDIVVTADEPLERVVWCTGRDHIETWEPGEGPLSFTVGQDEHNGFTVKSVVAQTASDEVRAERPGLDLPPEDPCKLDVPTTTTTAAPTTTTTAAPTTTSDVPVTVGESTTSTGPETTTTTEATEVLGAQTGTGSGQLPATGGSPGGGLWLALGLLGAGSVALVVGGRRREATRG